VNAEGGFVRDVAGTREGWRCGALHGFGLHPSSEFEGSS
jgi:hypothetical protein